MLDLIKETKQYLTKSSILKYIAIAICGILVIQLMFKNIKNKLSLLVQILVVGAIIYFIMKYDIYTKKEEDIKLNTYTNTHTNGDNTNGNNSSDEPPTIFPNLLEKDKEAFQVYKDILDLRVYNDNSYDTSMVRYMEFMDIKDLIIHSNSENMKGLYETTEMKIELCLNDLLTVSKNVSDEDSLRIQSAVRKLYKRLYGLHMLEIKIHLKKVWKENEITVTSFPITLENTKIKGDITTDKYYSEHYSVY